MQVKNYNLQSNFFCGSNPPKLYLDTKNYSKSTTELTIALEKYYSIHGFCTQCNLSYSLTGENFTAPIDKG